MHFGRHRTNVPLITMHYRKFTLAPFIYAVTAASKRCIAAPEDDAFPATYLSSTSSGFSAASRGTHEGYVIDGLAGAFGDPQVQSIEEDEIIGVKYLVTQYVMKLRSQPQRMTSPVKA